MLLLSVFVVEFNHICAESAGRYLFVDLHFCPPVCRKKMNEDIYYLWYADFHYYRML